ncbi:unnamed protein product [Urochloa decumbens]|uniref:Uncharacterized protein n=1 Tax=Urochloa decumbens TaxID=240449 RepID=A0ABC9FMW0_9POAL
MAAVREIRRAQRADGPAAMLGIGTANPAYCVPQDDFPDYYFRVTKKEHLTDLKDTFTKLCRVPGAEEAFLPPHEANAQRQPGLPRRQSLVGPRRAPRHRRQGRSGARRVGCRQGDRTVGPPGHRHHPPHRGHELRGTLPRRRPRRGLPPRPPPRRPPHRPPARRLLRRLRLAKDLAENNCGARVLVACVELTVTSFRGPRDSDTFDTLIPQALFGDGAGAVVVGADTAAGERPLFEMVSAAQTTILGTEHLLNMRLGEGGIAGDISFDLPSFAAENLEPCLLDAFRQLAIGGAERKWNDLFWVVHPGSRGILDHIDAALRLDPGKLAASRAVVTDYGNMLSVTVIFVLEELRRRMDEEGDEAEWGIMVGFGPGFTVETMVLHATK